MHGVLDVRESDPNEVGTVSVSIGASIPKRTRSDPHVTPSDTTEMLAFPKERLGPKPPFRVSEAVV